MERDTKRFEDLASVLSVGHLGSEDEVRRIDGLFANFRTQPVAPLVVAGPLGSNKSALVAHWLRTTRLVPPGSVVFYHSAAFSNASADPTKALRRLVSLLQGALGWGSTSLPTDLANVAALLPELLLNVSAHKTVVIVLDGFDTLLAADKSEIRWFPSRFPANTLVLLSSSDLRSVQEMTKKYEWRIFELEAASLKDKGVVISKILSQQAKSIPKEILRPLLTAECTNERLFLMTLVEDLISIPPEKMDVHLNDYLRSRNTYELFLKIVKRLETTFPPQLIEGILKRLCLSRHGLSQRELLAMMQLEKVCDALTFEMAWAEMGHLFLKVGDLYLFASEVLKEFVQQIYLGQQKSVEAVARKIANFFEKLMEMQRKKGTVDDRVLEELPYALVKTGDPIWLKDVLLDHNMFLRLSTKEKMYELREFWSTLGTPEEMAAEYCETVVSFMSDEDRPSTEVMVQLFNRVAELALEVGAHQYALFIAEKAVEFKTDAISPRNQEVAQSYHYQGLVYTHTKKYDKAIPLLSLTLLMYDEGTGPGTKTMIEVLTQLAACYEATGQYEQTIPLYARCSAIQKKTLGPTHPSVADSLAMLAATQEYLGYYDKADLLYQHCLAIQEQALGRNHPEVSATLHRMGLLYQKMGALEKANDVNRRAFAITEATLGKDHPDVATALTNQAKLFEAMAKYDEALPLYERALSIRERYFGASHSEVATALNNMGVLYFSMGRLNVAENMYNRALEIRERAYGMDHPLVANVLNNLGVIHERNQDNDEALQHHNQALAIQESHLGRNHPDIATTLNNKAVIAEKLRDFETAKDLYARALAIQEKAHGPDHPDVAVALNNQGALLKKMGRGADALATFDRAANIAQRTLGPGHFLIGAIAKNKVELVNENPSLLSQTLASSTATTGAPANSNTPSTPSVKDLRRGSSDPLLTASPTRTFHTGELLKKSGFAERWRKRLFFINKTRLEWYEDGESVPKNYVLFSAIIGVVPVDETKYKRKFVFEVVSEDNSYTLQADTEESMREWVEKLKEATNRK